MDPTPRMPRRRLPGQLPSILVSVAIVLVATMGVAAVTIIARPSAPQPAGSGAAAGATASPGASQPVAAETTLPTGAPAGSCEQHTLNAPAEGRWVLYRAEYGSRGGHDYLRLKLRRDGTAGEAARMTAELIAASEMPERHGQEAPAGADRALVARFDGPVRVPGQFGGRGSGALGPFSISGRGGSTYVVAAINGDRCFALDGGDWASGESGDQVDITLLIER